MRIEIRNQDGKLVYVKNLSWPCTEEGQKDEADIIDRITAYIEGGPT